MVLSRLAVVRLIAANALLLITFFFGGAKVAAQTAALTVDGSVPRPLKLTTDELAKVPHVKVQAIAHDGKEAAYEGVPLIELLKVAGVEFGERMRGKALANYVVVEAVDGYRVVFALPEIDPEFNERSIILADKRDGKALDDKHGPWQMIVVGEKRHGRWVRQVTAIRVRLSS
jgi:DMSO/TMAO reductase YedYZ molybdopterin-dependent catalytic subunit